MNIETLAKLVGIDTTELKNSVGEFNTLIKAGAVEISTVSRVISGIAENVLAIRMLLENHVNHGAIETEKENDDDA